MTREPTSTASRIVAFGIGLVLVGCAAAIVFLVPLSNLPAMIAAAVIFAVGVEALFAAVRARVPLIARIGPLP